MKTYSTTIVTGAVLTALFAFSVFARGHSALNGTWTLTPAKSDFAGQAVLQTGTVTIDDHEGIIVVQRNFVYEGATETFFYRDITMPSITPPFTPAKSSRAKPSGTTTS
jgi:hypothetical protein